MVETSSLAGTVMEGNMAIITSLEVVLDARVFLAADVVAEARMVGVGVEGGVDVNVS